MKNLKLLIVVLFVFVSLLTKLYFINSINTKGMYQKEFVYKNGDASHYIIIAENIKNNWSYSDNNNKITESATWRPPFWPLLLSIYMFFTSSFFGIAIVKIVFESFLLVTFLYCFKKNEHQNFLFFLLSLLILFEPQYLKYSTTFLSESITAILILLLGIVFYLSIKNDKPNIFISLLSNVAILSHPASIFFIFLLIFFYFIYFSKKKFRKVFTHIILFFILLSMWPLRNHLVFNQGAFITTSQGATFSKGWNDNVLNDFNNVDGDLADESLNLKYLNNPDIVNKEFIQMSKIYRDATIHFFKNQDYITIFKIAFKKVKSNFNPFPEKNKKGMLENLGVIFRVLYLLLFFQSIYLIFNNKFKVKNIIFPIIVVFIYSGQVFLSILIYSGIRFNSIYGLILFFCLLIVNFELLNRITKKIVKLCSLTP